MWTTHNHENRPDYWRLGIALLLVGAVVWLSKRKGGVPIALLLPPPPPPLVSPWNPLP